MQKTLPFFMTMFFFTSCDKDELSKGTAIAKPSFSSQWEFKAEFSTEDDLYGIQLSHYNDSTGVIHVIRFSNIPSIEDTIILSYKSELPWINENIPTAKYYVQPEDDTIAEHYVIDSSNIKHSYLVIKCATKSRISGEFKIYFMLSSRSILPKLSPNIPDYFWVEDGEFNAERF